MTYTIKPLQWDATPLDSEGEGVTKYVSTVFGSISVQRYYERWQYNWCFDDYYDEGVVDCDDEADAIAKAEAFYLERILPALVPA